MGKWNMKGFIYLIKDIMDKGIYDLNIKNIKGIYFNDLFGI